jgi:uncharacterized membrane protein HdeD (DUF308 family)
MKNKQMKPKKLQWLFTVTQGLILLLTGFVILSGIVSILQQFWMFNFVILIVGVLGIAEWFVSKPFDRSTNDFAWNSAVILIGLSFFLFKNNSIELIFIGYCILILISGIWLASSGCELYWISPLSWILMITGFLLLIFGTMLLFFLRSQIKLLESATGLVFLLMGAAIFVLGLLKKWLLQQG